MLPSRTRPTLWCGSYHSAGNTLSVAAFRRIAEEGLTGEEWLCKVHDADWKVEDSWFARCGAGLGMEEVEFKLWQVLNGDCPDPRTADGELVPLSPWEHKQSTLRTIQQRTCNPVLYYGQANDLCPAA